MRIAQDTMIIRRADSLPTGRPIEQFRRVRADPSKRIGCFF